MCKCLAIFGIYFAIFTSSVLAQEQGKPVLANIDYSLSSDDLAKLSAQALDGSIDAAERVSNYYHYIKRDEKQSLHWALVGAENGSTWLQLIVYQDFSESKKTHDHRRALFWLKRAADAGDQNAIDIYKTCNSLDSHLNNPQKTPCFGRDLE